MADFAPAVERTLLAEGGFSINRKTGEIVNFGITLAFLLSKGIPADVEYVRALTREQAKALYLRYFWDAYSLGRVTDQRLAARVFDLTVNCGPGGWLHGRLRDGGITMLQAAVNGRRPSRPLLIDGACGPLTVAAVNDCEPIGLYSDYVARAKAHYQAIAANNPLLADQLDGWLLRLKHAG